MRVLVNVGHPDLTQLNPCSGMRETEDWFRPCPAGCVAHFDVWADGNRHYDVTGGAYCPLPNSILSWVHLLPGSTRLLGGQAGSHYCPWIAETFVRMYRNDDVFHGNDGDPTRVWVVIVDAPSDDAHYAALFATAIEAELFFAAEVANREENCPCGELADA